MSIQRTAATLYRALKDDAAAVAALRAERATLAQALALNPEYGREITSATVNGQSYGAEVTMTNQRRLDLLDRFIMAVDAGVPPASRAYAKF